VDLFPSASVSSAFIGGLNDGDPVAERFVAETYHGDLGARRAREFVERAQRDGIDSVPEAPESMRALFAEFEQLPDWVDRAIFPSRGFRSRRTVAALSFEIRIGSLYRGQGRRPVCHAQDKWQTADHLGATLHSDTAP
jgi:hypothetical protein